MYQQRTEKSNFYSGVMFLNFFQEEWRWTLKAYNLSSNQKTSVIYSFTLQKQNVSVFHQHFRLDWMRAEFRSVVVCDMHRKSWCGDYTQILWGLFCEVIANFKTHFQSKVVSPSTHCVVKVWFHFVLSGSVNQSFLQLRINNVLYIDCTS